MMEVMAHQRYVEERALGSAPADTGVARFDGVLMLQYPTG
jgi:hypothetical protein